MDYTKLKAGDKVRLKPARKNSSLGYEKVAGQVLTIKKVFPQYDWACTFEEDPDPHTIYRMKDIMEVVE